MAVSSNGASNVRSSFLAVRMLMCYSAGLSVRNRPCAEQSPYLEFARICHRRLELDGVDQGLSQSNILDDRIVKPIHIVPDCDGTTNAHSEREKNPRETTYEHIQLIFSSL